MKTSLSKCVDLARTADARQVERALDAADPDIRHFAALVSPAADAFLEPMARRAQALTRRYFGRTISLYVPLYVSNYCPGGCAYCGFASDREQPRMRLSRRQLLAEIDTLKGMGFEDVLLLTGERAPEAGFEYLRSCVAAAAGRFHNVSVESFAMAGDEYRKLAEAGCTGITLYQETYDIGLYRRLHRWGPKRDYASRLEAPARALSAGMRTVGIGTLLGLGDPVREAICLFDHAVTLRKAFWREGVMVSFPRLCSETGGFAPDHPVDDRLLARIIFAFRICMPDVPLVLSTREKPSFRDGMAGVGISRMSVASRTTVGGYRDNTSATTGQFDVNDERDVLAFCRALRRNGLDPVFKNWDSVFRD